MAKVVPLGIASAMSPVVFGIALALLVAKEHTRLRMAAYFAGALVTVIILALVGSAVGSGALEGAGLPADVDLLLGILLIVFAVKTGLEKGEKKRKVNAEGGPAHLLKWFAIGFVVNITNLDAVLLNLTAVKEIFEAGVGFGYEMGLVAVCDLFFLSPILVPVVVYALMPKAAERVLKPIGASLEKYGRYIVSLIFLIFGIYLISKGLA